MPIYVDMFSILESAIAKNLSLSSFLHQTSLSTPPMTALLSDLGRSGRQFQLCYNLKTVCRDTSFSTLWPGQEWVVHEAVFYHQFDVEEGTALWIVAHKNPSIREKFGDTKSIDNNTRDRELNILEHGFQRSLSTHLFFCQRSAEGWNSYLKELEDFVLKDVSAAILCIPPIKYS